MYCRRAAGLVQNWFPSAEYLCFGWVFCAHSGEEGRMVQLSLQVVLCSPSTGFLADEPEVCDNRAVLPAEHDPL